MEGRGGHGQHRYVYIYINKCLLNVLYSTVSLLFFVRPGLESGSALASVGI